MIVVSGGLVLAPGLGGQEPDSAADGSDACVCPEPERIRERVDHVRERLETVRRRTDRARRRVRGAALGLESRGRLGIEIALDRGEAPEPGGARVVDVANGTPAAEAGIRAGDLIVALDQRSLLDPLADPEEEDDLDPEASLPAQRLVAIMADREPGDTVDVAFLRDGERREVAVELEAAARWARLVPGGPDLRFGARPDGFRSYRVRPPRDRRVESAVFGGEPGVAWLGARPDPWELCEEVGDGVPGVAWLRWLRNDCVAGLRVEAIGPELGEYFGSSSGVLVLEVAEESTLGLRPGDVVASISDRSVEDVDDMARILGSYEEGEEVRFRVRRRGSERTVTGTMP